MIRAFRRLGRVWRAVMAGAAILLLLIGYLGVTFVQVWMASRGDEPRSADAIVVLGAAQYDGRPSPVLQRRLDHALDLHRRGIAPLIVVTGGRRQGDRFTEATAGYNYLRAHGVPDSAIRKEVQGSSTYESITAAARFLDDEGIERVVLISDRAPSKRMRGIASEVGLEAQISPAGSNASAGDLMRETAGVALARFIGYRRLDGIR